MIKLEQKIQECYRCKVKRTIKQRFSWYIAEKFCETNCPTGKTIKRLRESFNGAKKEHKIKLTQETYERLSASMTDNEIKDLLGISVSTLTRRKNEWGLTNTQKRQQFNMQDYQELCENFTDVEIADMYGIPVKRLRQWKARYYKRGKL